MSELLPYDPDIPLIDSHPDRWRLLMDIRGGCRCWTGCAPCSPCVNPPTEEELSFLGFPPEDNSPQPEPVIDYMQVTRDLCR